MSEHKNTPELRFPEFKDEWYQSNLDEMCSFTSGGTPSRKTNKYWDGDIPWITTSDLNNKFIKNIFTKITSSGLKNSSAKLITEPAIILAMYGQGKTRGKCSILNFPATTNQACAILQPNEFNNIEFVYQFLEKNYTYLRAQSNEGSQKNLSLSLLKKIKINYPSLFEQNKISDFFSKLDRQIELEEEKLELLEQQKRGYIQKIFSQGLRFKDEEGNYYKEWDTKQLKDVLEFSNKRTTNENEYPVLTSSRQGLILQSDYYKDGKTFAESNIGYFILPKNYITYRSRSDDGIFKFNLNQIIDVGIISKYYPVFKGINTNQYYLTLHLNYQLKKEYIKYATGTSQLVLSKKNLQNIQTKLPSYEEQTKIANFLSELDKLIEKQSDKVELLKDRKKGLLQKMFV
ncbi:restriction endonuclease subunit S [Staphylococcus sp. HMSC072E01]|uniref:restriction endonuclease subunit S n=1 Tax=Staphylococcus TaxID=1279 RepID=UPI0008A5D3DA|nr:MULTISPECIES: restriction endonuclease subunit S [Staphylococcus]OFQ09483.1 restriction endonuclease subunit S [Staphylococcus sp. HMSC072E01]